jgi:GNAT superfamily N-acetyltransferase
VKSVKVHKEAQGKGIGTKILEGLIHWLKVTQLNPILITKPSEESFFKKFRLIFI